MTVSQKEVKSPESETATDIHVNQIGYIPDRVKRAIVVGGGREFYVVNAETNEIEFKGNVEKGSRDVDKYSGDVVCYADFSEFTSSGDYYIYVPNGDVSSYTFTIGENVFHDIAKASLKSIYFQRCGQALDEKYAGNAARGTCHMYESEYFPINGESKLVLGGWHDAGDCGDYTMVTCMVLELMFIQYDLMPEVYGDDTNIPESENGIPDIFDEARVGIDWLFQMQDDDGGVFHSRGNNGGCPFDPVDQDREMYYLWPKTVEATCTFVSAMNSAYKAFKDIDAEYAEKCKTAALNSMDWLLENWDDDSKTSNIYLEGSLWSLDDTGMGMFSYMDNQTRVEEHMAASLAYYELTGDETWHQRFIDDCAEKSTMAATIDYSDYAFVTMYKYLKSDVEKNDKTERLISIRFKNRAIDIVDQFDTMDYRIANSGDKFGWGSNYELVSQLIMLVLIDDVNGTQGSHDDIIIESVDYILGKNAVGYCFITGYGSKPVLHMHHKETYQSDKLLPGYMVSGPVEYAVASATNVEMLDSKYGLSNDTPNLKSFYDAFELYRFTESDMSRLIGSSFILHYVDTIK